MASIGGFGRQMVYQPKKIPSQQYNRGATDTTSAFSGLKPPPTQTRDLNMVERNVRKMTAPGRYGGIYGANRSPDHLRDILAGANQRVATSEKAIFDFEMTKAKGMAQESYQRGQLEESRLNREAGMEESRLSREAQSRQWGRTSKQARVDSERKYELDLKRYGLTEKQVADEMSRFRENQAWEKEQWEYGKDTEWSGYLKQREQARDHYDRYGYWPAWWDTTGRGY